MPKRTASLSVLPEKPQALPLTRDDLWRAVLAEAELEVSRPNFHTWFRKTLLAGVEDGIAQVRVPNSFAKEWLEAKYRRFVLRVLRKYDAEVRDVAFMIGKAEEPAFPPERKDDPSSAATPLPLKNAGQEPGLNPRYTFSSFVVGPSNELAHAAATAVVKQLGTLYNPLFIYGGVGLGKTHLLQAIGNHIVRESPQRPHIRYISSERFTHDFVAALKTRTTDRFKDHYRLVDVLIIDDVQFIAGKERTQEELFHTFNELSGRGAQIVFSSDRPPYAIPGLADRLRSRFEGGMIADIQPPEFETRVAILQTKARERGMELRDEPAHLIARLVERNARELEGALNRVLSVGAIAERGDFDSGKIQEALRASLPPPHRMAFRDVVRAIAKFYDLREDELFEKSRRQEIVHPRQIAMYLLRDMLTMSYPAIGKRFRGLDHTTVMHACSRIKGELQSSSPIADEIAEIRNILRSTSA